MTTQRCRRLPEKEKIHVLPIAFSADSKTLVAGGMFGRLRLWDVSTGREVRHVQSPGREWVQQLNFSADGRLLATSSNDGPITLWQTNNWKQLGRIDCGKHGDGPVRLSPDGRLVLAPGPHQSVVVRERETSRAIVQLQGDAGRVTDACFTPDSKRVVMSGSDGTALVWDLDLAARVRRLPALVERLDRQGQPLPPGALARVGSLVFQPGRWDWRTGQLVRQMTLGGEIRDLTFSPDGQCLAVALSGKNVVFCNPATGERLGSIRHPTDFVDSLAFSPNGRLLALAGWSGGGGEASVYLWDLRDEKPVGLLPVQHSRIASLAFSAAGRVLHVYCPPHEKQETGKPPAATIHEPGCCQVWDVSAGKRLARFPFDDERYSWPIFAFSPQGRFLAREEPGDHFEVREPGTNRKLLTLPGKPLSLAFSGDEKVLAVFLDDHGTRRIRLIETATGQQAGTLLAPAGSGKLAFSPDGRCLVEWPQEDSEAPILVYDLGLGRALGRVTGHMRSIAALSFSPDGKKLATGCDDQTALVWDATWPTLLRRPAQAGRLDVEALWQDLASAEAERAWRAVWQLALSPEQSLPLLQHRLQPIPSPNGKRLARLLAELDHDDFARREAARKEILSVGETALSALRRRLQEKPSLNLKRLLEGLLEDIEPRPNAPGRLLDSRALAVLERIGSTEGRRVLQRLASGVEGHSRTELARETLRRLERRTGP